MEKSPKALVLLSGGLDSILAAKLLTEQRIKVTGLIFKSCFFDERAGIAAAEQLGIPYRVIDFSKKHLALVKNPPRGYGKAANPCIDCHLMMLTTAREIMENEGPARPKPCAKEGYDFVATGEVLGERPFSQNKQALEIIARKSGLRDRLLRPLSAKLLSPTLPEETGLVDRGKLMDIQGRQRQPQIELAKKYKLSYPAPAGGCILCEREFGRRLFELFEKWPEGDADDIELLKLGRQFWHDRTKIVLGRNQEDNQRLKSLAKAGDILLKPAGFPGPTALIRGEKVDDRAIEKARSLILSYSKKLPPRLGTAESSVQIRPSRL